MMLATCSVGSYLSIRAINCMCGYYSNYYNEFMMVKLKEKDLLETIRHTHWAYIALFVTLFALGTFT